jgi:hypothetical protein
MKPNTIKIDDVEYVRTDSVNQQAEKMNGLEYKIVRTRSAGVFAGYLEELDGQTAHMVNARRIWYWSGAASLSQLALDGTSKPKDCKFPAPVTVTLFEVIEILEVTKKAQESIEAVAVWKQ